MPILIIATDCHHQQLSLLEGDFIGFYIPVQRLSIIGRHPIAKPIKLAQIELCRGIALLRQVTPYSHGARYIAPFEGVVALLYAGGCERG